MNLDLRNRGVLSLLIVFGFALAGMVTALGAGIWFQGESMLITARLDDHKLIITKNGEVHTFTLPRGGNYSIETSEKGISIILKIENETLSELEDEINELVEIAKKDELVSELLKGKDYEVITVTKEKLHDEYTAVLVLKVEGKHYKITLDLNSETVKSVDVLS